MDRRLFGRQAKFSGVAWCIMCGLAALNLGGCDARLAEDTGRFDEPLALHMIELSGNGLVLTAPDDVIFECDPGRNDSALTQWLSSASVESSCENVSVLNDFTGLSDDCGVAGSATVVWTASDDCGNTLTHTASFAIIDSTAPEVAGPESAEVDCDGAATAAALELWLNGATATDDCGATTVSRETLLLSSGCDGFGTTQATWTATDECGNLATYTATFTVTDTVARLVIDAPEDLSVECDGVGNESAFRRWVNTATAEGGCSEVMLTYELTRTAELCGATSAAEVTWSATDDCGGTDAASSTFTIVDTTPPRVTGPDDLTIVCDENGPDEDLPAWLDSTIGQDVCGDVLTTTTLHRGVDACVTEAVWTVTDDCGLSTTRDATFTILGDEEPPTITLNGPPELVVECGVDDPPEFGAAASDFCDKSVTEAELGGDPPDLNTPGTYVVTYTASDSCGNRSAMLEQIIDVVDTLPPFIPTGQLIELWPSNHKYRTLRLSDCEVRDSCEEGIDANESGSILWAYSDEPENSTGDGNTVDDIVIVNESTFKVRAERAGSGNGRVYGVVFEISDSAGNTAELLCRAGTPHDQSGGLPIDDGPAAGYTVE